MPNKYYEPKFNGSNNNGKKPPKDKRHEGEAKFSPEAKTPGPKPVKY